MNRSERSHRRGGRQRAGRTAQPEAELDQPEAAATAPSVRFEVRCGCGAVLRGQRETGETSALCPGCGRELSLLPIQPVKPSPPPGAEPVTVLRPSVGSELCSAGDSPGDSATDSAEAAVVHPERREQRRHLAWLRLGAAAALLLVVATAYWGWHQRRQRRAIVELHAALTEGRSALESGDADRAVASLARAAQAAERLGATAGQGPQARQLYREATVWSELPMTSIDDFFFDHAADAVSNSSDTLRAAFNRDLAGRSLVIQGRISPTTPAARNTPAADVDAPRVKGKPAEVSPQLTMALDWTIVGENFHVEIAAADLSALTHLAEGEVLFGAEIKSLERDPQHPGRWLVRLVPPSVVLLTAAGPFAYYHWPDLEAVETLLDQQRQIVLPSAVAAPPEAAAASAAPAEDPGR